MQRPILRSLSLTGAAALAMASMPQASAKPVEVAQGSADDLGVMGLNLMDAVKLNYGFQGALQGAGTPNQAGVGAFIPLHVSNNSVAFVDVLVNANFSDYSGYSSIGTTKVAGTTFSTSTRLGYRWLNKDRSWMYGINAGWDSRPMATGGTDNGAPVTDSQTVFFQQVALSLEAKSNKLSASAYALVPVGEHGAGTGKVAVINSSFIADSLSAYGLDIGYKVKPNLKLALGTYYQLDDKEDSTATGFGVKTGLTYDITNELQAGVIYSYDGNFESRISGNLKWRFGGSSQIKKVDSVLAVNPVIQALSATPENRDVRVANCIFSESICNIFREIVNGGSGDRRTGSDRERTILEENRRRAAEERRFEEQRRLDREERRLDREEQERRFAEERRFEEERRAVERERRAEEQRRFEEERKLDREQRRFEEERRFAEEQRRLEEERRAAERERRAEERARVVLVP